MSVSQFTRTVIGEGQTVDDSKPTPLIVRRGDQALLRKGSGSPQPPIGQPPAATDTNAGNTVTPPIP